MFHLFNKKETFVVDNNLYAPAKGQLINITDVKDEVFSSKMMGDGFAIHPTSGNITSPVSGKIITIFQTKHAICINMANGLEVLIHLGINTVELHGIPFDICVKEGQNIQGGEKIAMMDLSMIRDSKKDTTVIVVFTNSHLLQHLTIHSYEDTVENGAMIGEVAVEPADSSQQ